MENVIADLTTGLSSASIWGAIGPVVPIVLAVTLVAITRKIVNKNLSRGTSGKSGKV